MLQLMALIALLGAIAMITYNLLTKQLCITSICNPRSPQWLHFLRPQRRQAYRRMKSLRARYIDCAVCDGFQPIDVEKAASAEGPFGGWVTCCALTANSSSRLYGYSRLTGKICTETWTDKLGPFADLLKGSATLNICHHPPLMAGSGRPSLRLRFHPSLRPARKSGHFLFTPSCEIDTHRYTVCSYSHRAGSPECVEYYRGEERIGAPLRP
jgi:hypothetical protein